ncbi:hypothetical protein BH09BAC1_BH09BAC1_05000 [soil metagenome]
MNTVTINVRDLLATAYGNGIVALYQLPEALDTPETTAVVVPDMLYNKEGEGRGLLGHPIFQSIAFTNGNERYILGDCIVDINLTKVVVKTARNGTDGTVKEFIANGDFQVNIKGFMVGDDPYSMPDNLIWQFRSFFIDKKKALGVEGKIFDLLGIYNLVVESIRLPQLPTYINIRPFELTCVSDDPTEIMLLKDA